VEPFLVRAAQPRIPISPIPGEYSNDLEVWIEEIAGRAIPLVEARQNIAELVTKTCVDQEQDEDGEGGRILAELATKTEVQQESDDRSNSDLLLELQTKTAHNIEHDDESRPVL
jgi:hypothetical protein